MREANLQQKIKQISSQHDIICVKVDSTSSRGWPDLTCVLPNGTVLFVELKTATGRLSKLQEYMIAKLKTNKANVYVIRSTEEYLDLINAHL